MSAGPVASAATTPTASPRPGRAEWLIVPGNFITCLGNGIQLDATGVLLVRADKSALAVAPDASRKLDTPASFCRTSTTVSSFMTTPSL